MTYVTDLVDEGNLCGLVIVALILGGVGQRMVQSKPSLQLWGLRIAALVFVAFTIMRIIELGVPATSDLLSAVIVGLAAGALVLGPSWIVLSMVGFVYEHYLKMSRVAHARVETRKRKRQQRREQRRQSQQQEAEPLSPEQEEAEREAEREAEEQRRCELEGQMELSKRRENAIAECEVMFHLRAPDIADRFSREQFDEFVKKYMRADKSIGVIEQRASELQQLIQQHFETNHPPTRFTELSGLTAWYERQIEQIRSLTVPDIYKEDFLVQLNERYAELTQQMLEKL